MYLLFNLLASAVSGEGDAVSDNPTKTYILWGTVIVIFGVWIFLSYRSNKKRKQENEEKMNNLQVGTSIKTIGLICGTIVSINDEKNTITIKTGNEENFSFIEIDKMAVYQVEAPQTVTDAPQENFVEGESQESEMADEQNDQVVDGENTTAENEENV